MRSLIINNFRGFSYFKVDFRPGTNLLVGDNASGKTSLLKACKYVLSAFFSGFNDENTTFITPRKEDYHNVVIKGNLLPPEPIELKFDITDFADKEDYPEQVYIKKSGKNSKPLLGGFKELKMYGQNLLNNLYSDGSRKEPLPLFAAFSTEDIHSTRKISADKFKTYIPKNSFGYYECLNANGLLKYWLNRMLILAEAEEEKELTIVRKALLSALGKGGCDIISDLKVRPLRRKVFFTLSDGREVETDLLSDGYKRLVNIVIDLSFRAVILNGNLYDEEVLAETRGTVLIDEVDLHLHPSLQGTVLNGLRRAFPKLQIIASTHSPIVMSGVTSDENNSVQLMRYNQEDKSYVAYNENTYGLDSTLIIEDTLHLPSRDKKVDADLQALFDSIDSEDLEKAVLLLKIMREEFGDRLPELERASTILNFMLEDNEED